MTQQPQQGGTKRPHPQSRQSSRSRKGMSMSRDVRVALIGLAGVLGAALITAIAPSFVKNNDNSGNTNGINGSISQPAPSSTPTSFLLTSVMATVSTTPTASVPTPTNTPTPAPLVDSPTATVPIPQPTSTARKMAWGELRFTLVGHTGIVRSASYSRDGLR